MTFQPKDTDLGDTEVEALHALQLGREHLQRAHGELLSFHHDVGRGMSHYERANELLREVGHDELADELLDPLKLGVIEGQWSCSVVEEFENHFLDRSLSAEETVRDTLADGERHLNERAMECHRRERADGESPSHQADEDGR